MASVNNFLLVFNSSVNIVIYSFFNAQFRNAASELLGPALEALRIVYSRKSSMDAERTTVARETSMAGDRNGLLASARGNKGGLAATTDASVTCA